MASVPDQASPVVVVTGSVTYRERIALPPGAVLTVSVEDVSRADAPATTLARTAVTVDGQVPVPFSVAIDAADIDPRARVAVRARLRSSVGTWVSDTHHPVDFHGAGSVATSSFGGCRTDNCQSAVGRLGGGHRP